MATVPVQPRLLRNYLFTVDADEFAAALESIQFAPSASAQTWTGGNGVTHSDMPPATWLCNVGHIQDWETIGSLGEYLLTNEGEQVEVKFVPNPDAGGVGPTFTATVTLTPSAIGGTNGAWPSSSVALPSTKPVLTRPTPTP